MADTLQSVTHALRVLRLLRRRSALGVSEVAGELGVGVSTAHRLLATLAAEGFVHQGRGRKYELTGETLGSTSAVEHCAEVATGAMRRLRDASGETVHLSIVRGDRTLFVSAVESDAMVRVTSRVGERPPAHTTAAGKVLYTSLSRAEFLELFPEPTLSQATPQTIGDREELWAEVRRVEADGFARNRGESEEDMLAFAVPIQRPAGPPVCALSLAAPQSRIRTRSQQEGADVEARLLDQLRAAAREIADTIAF